MQRPILGLLSHPGRAEPVVQLLVELQRWCDPRAANPRHESAAAWLATAPDALWLSDALRTGRPVAVCARGRKEQLAAQTLDPALVLSLDENAVRGRADCLPIPDARQLDAALIPWQPPFVRRRRRVAAGLPSELVVDLRDGHGRLAATGLVSTALAVAAAAMVDAQFVAEGLAWGTPMVLTQPIADRFHLVPGRHVLAAEATEAPAVARQLAQDETQAARLSREGRRLAERRHDMRATAAVVAERLRLVKPQHWQDYLDAVLARLDTPFTAPVRIRSERMIATVASGS